MAGEPITGYLLVEAAREDINALTAQLRSLDGVQFAHALLGPTDIIAYVETDGWDSFNALLNGSIRALETSGLARHVETRLTVKPSAGSIRQQCPIAAAWQRLDLPRSRSGRASRRHREARKRSTTSSWPTASSAPATSWSTWSAKMGELAHRPRHSDPHHPRRSSAPTTRPILMRRPAAPAPRETPLTPAPSPHAGEGEPDRHMSVCMEPLSEGAAPHL